jgi:hypothetical protein
MTQWTATVIHPRLSATGDWEPPLPACIAPGKVDPIARFLSALYLLQRGNHGFLSMSEPLCVAL